MAVILIVGIAGMVLATQCQFQPAELGRCLVGTDPIATASIEPDVPTEANTSTLAMTSKPAARPVAPDPAPPADDLIDATFRLLPSEPGLPLAASSTLPPKEDITPAEDGAPARGTPLWTRVEPLAFSEPVQTADKATAAPIPADRMSPTKVAYAAEPAVDEMAPADDSAAAAATSLAGSGAVRVSESPLNVRTGPSTSQARVFVLEPGKEVEIIEEGNGWARVVDAQGRKGWVDAAYLVNPGVQAPAAPAEHTAGLTSGKAEEPAAARPASATGLASSDKRIVGGSGVNVRSGPSKASGKLFALAAGQEVTITGNDKGWLQVIDAKGRSGWIYKTYLSAPK